MTHEDWTLGAIAARLGGRVAGNAQLAVSRITAIDDAGPDAMTFATDDRYLARALESRAAAVLTDETFGATVTTEKPLVLVPSTRLALAALLAELEPERPRGPLRDPSAVVAPSARIGEEVVIGPHVTVGAEVSLGDRVVVGAGCVIGERAAVGDDTILHPRAYVADRCIVGARCVIGPGAVLGSDGFGFAFLDGRLKKIPQIGIVRLGDDVEIGANTTIDRAQTSETSVGDGTKIDNLCQIGHNCRIGKHCAFAAFCGLAGSTIVGDYVQVGGGAIFKGHITVGSRATVVGQTEVWGDVPEGAVISGRPGRPHRERLRREVLFEKLPKLFARVELLESRGRSSED